MLKKIKKNTIYNTSLISKALLKMEKFGLKTLIVIDKTEKYLGTLSDGDVRRSLIKKKKLSDKINGIFKKKTIFLTKKKYSIKKVKDLFLKKRIDLIPVISKNKKILDILNYYNVNKKVTKKKKIKRIPSTAVVVVAGGKGTRLLPYTKILPKPLIPYKGKTLIEHVINQFMTCSLKNFIFTINYKALTFKAFFQELNPPINYKYIVEKKPLGTAGSLRKIDSKKFKNFFVATCDTLIQIDFHKVFQFHIKNNNDITIISAKISNKLPYGVLKGKAENKLEYFDEKPLVKYTVNTGMYLIKSEIFQLIPKNKFYNMNELILKAQSLGKNISLYKIKEKSWRDLGKISTFEK
jgi:dTDP-glucose pyrophosphorylase/CBS domain-containing protein